GQPHLGLRRHREEDDEGDRPQAQRGEVPALTPEAALGLCLRRLYPVAHEATSLALGVRIRERTVLTDSLASSLMRPPRWRSESAFANALYLPIRSQARSLRKAYGRR